MANPLSIQAIASLPKGAGQGTDNITSKVSSGAKFALGLGSIDQHASLRYDNIVTLKLKTNATAVTGNAILTIYVITSVNGTDWTDGIDPDSVSDQSSKISKATVAAVLTGIAASTTYDLPDIDIAALLGYQPLYFAIVYQLDVTAGGFDATAGNHTTKYSEIQYA